MPCPRTSLIEVVRALEEQLWMVRVQSWSWHEFLALPSEQVAADIHCVTRSSKLDTTWRGVSIDTLLQGAETAARFVTAWCDGGYTANLGFDDVTGGRAWIAYEFGGSPLEPEHGGPARLLVPPGTSGSARSGCVA